MKWDIRPSDRFAGQPWLVDADHRLWGICDFVKAKWHRPDQMYGLSHRQRRIAEAMIDAGWQAETYNFGNDVWTVAWHPQLADEGFLPSELKDVLALLPNPPERCRKTKDMFDAVDA